MHSNCRRLYKSPFHRCHPFRNMICPFFRMSHILCQRPFIVRLCCHKVNSRTNIITACTAILTCIIRNTRLNKHFVSDFKFCYFRSYFNNFSRHLMSETDLLIRIFRRNKRSKFKSMNIRSAHSDILYFHKNFMIFRLRNRTFLYFKMFWSH